MLDNSAKCNWQNFAQILRRRAAEENYLVIIMYNSNV